MRAITTVAEADLLTVEWVRAHVNLNAARAIDQDPQYNPPSNGQAPHQFDPLPLGTWRLDRFGEAWVLVRIPIDAFQPSEGDWGHARAHWSTRNYIKWMSDGIAPPPCWVLRQYNGALSGQNRRRWLAAREAGLDALDCWYSPSHAEFIGRSAWYLPEYNEAKIDAYRIKRAAGRNPRECMSAYEYAHISRRIQKEDQGHELLSIA